MVVFYLVGGATWGVNFMDVVFLVGLFSGKILCGVVLYLCFGGTWVHVTTGKDLLG